MSINSKPTEYRQLRLLAEERPSYVVGRPPAGEGKAMKIYTKESLVEELKKIRSMRWIPNARRGNVGGVGNTLEDLLGIEENNLPIPNASEWELKCHRANTSSLVTLLHTEPSPRALRFVSRVFLPCYSWPHQKAGTKYSPGEMSFRQTISGLERSDRGFKVIVDRAECKVLISFDASAVDKRHSAWLETVEKRVGLGELNPQPYWGFDDLRNKAGTKLVNCFYVQADVKREGKQEFFAYSRISILQRFNLEGLLSGIEQGYVYVDFDARTGHNHGTKFRLRQGKLPLLYGDVEEI